MARILHTDPNDLEFAAALLKQAANPREIRMAQSILLPARLNTTFAQTADMLGVSQRTVSRLRKDLRFLRENKYPGDRRGGRHRENMTLEEEENFLAPWAARAETGELVAACEIRQALAKALKRENVAESSVYRLLARHGWRKVAADTRHPKADVEKQEDFKKNSTKKWFPCWKAWI